MCERTNAEEQEQEQEQEQGKDQGDDDEEQEEQEEDVGGRCRSMDIELKTGSCDGVRGRNGQWGIIAVDNPAKRNEDGA